MAGVMNACVHQRKSPASVFPCHNGNSCTASSKEKTSSSNRKVLYVLGMSIESLFERRGLNHIGFLTLTFAEEVDAKEAQRRFHSLRTHVLGKRYKEFIRIYARSERGRIHYHVLVVTDGDIRTGCSFDRLKVGDYRHAPPALWEEWKFWSKTGPRYGFGRSHILPIEKNAQAVANYFRGNLASRSPEDKGVRLVAYSKGTAIGNTAFSWNNPGRLWRAKMPLFADVLGCKEWKDLSPLLGRYWAYKYRRFISHLTPETAADAKCILHESVQDLPLARRRTGLVRALDSLQNALAATEEENQQHFVKLALEPLAPSA